MEIKIDELTQENIEKELVRIQAGIDSREQENAIARQRINELQAELRRRELEAFWAAHPGERLEVEDKIKITTEYVQWYEDKMHQRAGVRDKEVYTITDLYINRDELRVNTDRLYLGGISLDIARRMRQAWLKRQKGE